MQENSNWSDEDAAHAPKHHLFLGSTANRKVPLSWHIQASPISRSWDDSAVVLVASRLTVVGAEAILTSFEGSSSSGSTKALSCILVSRVPSWEGGSMRLRHTAIALRCRGRTGRCRGLQHHCKDNGTGLHTLPGGIACHTQ